MQTTAVHAVFEGGGVKGISLVGAVKAAEHYGIRFERVAGTSSGSLVAALLAAGYNADEMKRELERTPLRSVLKRSRLFDVKLVGPALRLLWKKGLYSGDALEAWVDRLLRAKGIATFGDLPDGKLRIVASDISNGRLLVLPNDIAAYGIAPGRLAVARAVRMSTSIPYFFDPVVLRQSYKRRRKGEIQAKAAYIVDGGLLSNFPLWLFQGGDPSADAVPVVGFQMVGRSDSQPRPISGPVTMFQAMFETMLSAHDERYIEKNKLARTIKIPTLGVGTTQFHLSEEQSEQLYRSGLEAGERFFRNWDRKTGVLRVVFARRNE
ncbi:patatin-like phospholipase family protein [Paenibacillaceae bacterium WGS1546]|uniref:patatin-like phospholipase family protein n=1 Tax=Cohnella sp. WGS1546 TaxID=3366810 RepID=UPI00372D18A4